MTATAQVLSPRAIEILLVEDNPGDVMLTMEAFRMANVETRMQTAEDGQLALAYLDGALARKNGTRLPDLILLDLNLPRINGREVLQHIKQHEGLRRIPVIMLTTSDQPGDINDSYDHHANSYIIKPMDMKEFVQAVIEIRNFWFQTSTLPKH